MTNRPIDKKKYKIIDHTADLGIEVYGDNLNLLFSNAGNAFSEILTDVSKIEEHVSKDITVSGEDLEQLMVNWLHEILYNYEVNFLIFKRFIIKDLNKPDQNKRGIDSVYTLSCECYGEEFDQIKHDLLTEIKAVTYHQIEVKRKNEKWWSRIIFDL